MWPLPNKESPLKSIYADQEQYLTLIKMLNAFIWFTHINHTGLPKLFKLWLAYLYLIALQQRLTHTGDWGLLLLTTLGFKNYLKFGWLIYTFIVVIYQLSPAY